MSIPKRHHYVPRVHIDKFKSGSFFWLWNKDKQQLHKPLSSRDIFVKSELNTTGTESGQKDHVTLEEEFSKKWDSKFNKHFSEILNNLATPDLISQPTLKFFFEYSVVSYMRRLKMEPKFNDEFFDFTDLMPEILERMKEPSNQEINFDPIIKKAAIDFFESMIDATMSIRNNQSLVKFPGIIGSDAEMLVPEACNCFIYIADAESFILPDCTAFGLKSREIFEHHGTEFNKLSLVGIPLCPHVFLEVRNSEIIPGNNRVCKATEEDILNINDLLYETAFTYVLLNNQNQKNLFHKNTPSEP